MEIENNDEMIKWESLSSLEKINSLKNHITLCDTMYEEMLSCYKKFNYLNHVLIILCLYLLYNNIYIYLSINLVFVLFTFYMRWWCNKKLKYINFSKFLFEGCLENELKKYYSKD